MCASDTTTTTSQHLFKKIYRLSSPCYPLSLNAGRWLGGLKKTCFKKNQGIKLQVFLCSGKKKKTEEKINTHKRRQQNHEENSSHLDGFPTFLREIISKTTTNITELVSKWGVLYPKVPSFSLSAPVEVIKLELNAGFPSSYDHQEKNLKVWQRANIQIQQQQ